MTIARPVPGSYRDPAGAVHRCGDRVLRTVNPEYQAAFEAVLDTGALGRLQAAGRIVAFEVVSPSSVALDHISAGMVLEHPRLPFISHPYEWSFEVLRAAALHHLDTHLEAMADGVTLSDASAYNIQFVGAEPIFIDTLSFRLYGAGEFWAGYRQFCEQFLNPLLLCSATGLMPNAWYRGALEGIPTSDLKRLLPWRAFLSRRALLHVAAHSALERLDAPPAQARTPAGLPRDSFLKLLRDLRAWVASLAPKRSSSLWTDYGRTWSYTDDEHAAKRGAVAAFASAVRPATLWDMGCNTGEYAMLSLEAGAASVIGWDGDPAAVDVAFRAARASRSRFTPLVSNLANPSPSQGWGQSERAGLSERRSADAVTALALVHHLVFGANIPLPQAIGWLVGLAPTGLIEFVPPDDVQVRPMRARRNGLHHRYDRALFESALAGVARIQGSTVLGGSGRELFWYDRRG